MGGRIQICADGRIRICPDGRVMICAPGAPCECPAGLAEEYQVLGNSPTVVQVDEGLCLEPIVCDGQPAWDQKILKEEGECYWLIEMEEVCWSGRVLWWCFVELVTTPPCHWRLEAEMPVDRDGSIVLGSWIGHKTTGDSPVGVYTRTHGCMEPETMTVAEVT